MNESTQICVEVTPRIYDLIIDHCLVTLPVAKRRGIFPGALICFEEGFNYPSPSSDFYQYAIVKEVKDCRVGVQGNLKANFDMITFSLVDDLSDILIG